MSEHAIPLKSLKREDVPQDLRADTYFDFRSHPFEHQALFEETASVYGAILGISAYAERWLARTVAENRSRAKRMAGTTPRPAHTVGGFELFLEEETLFEPAVVIGRSKPGVVSAIYVARGARVIGAVLDVEKGSVLIGEGTVIEPGAGIKGPTIIGKETEIRQGAYVRGDVIIGNNATIRGEIKNCVLMDKANFPHPSYLGDSLCGYMTHFGNQATTANLGIFAGLVEPDKRKPLVIQCDGKAYDLGKPKMGICMGDFSQVGCNCVTDPGTFLKPYTIAYPLCRIPKGFYGPHEVLKNKPLEHGVIERSPYRKMF